MYTYSATAKIDITVKNCKYNTLIKAFIQSIRPLFEAFVSESLHYFSEQYKKDGTLERLFGFNKLIWKSSTGNRTTKIKSMFGWIRIPQLQVQDGVSKCKRYITRLLLGLERMQRIPFHTYQVWGLMASLAPYRVVQKFVEMWGGFKVSLWGLRNAAIKLSKTLTFGVAGYELGEFEADGTGIPIVKSGKRGEELKVVVQRKKSGGLRVVGMVLGAYKDKANWKHLFEPVKQAAKRFKGGIKVITDGETSIFEDLKDHAEIILQRCLWHIPHELKYTLWMDKVKRECEEWKHVMSEILDTCRVKRIRENEAIVEKIITKKQKQVECLITHCHEQGYTHTATFLTNALEDMYTGISKGIGGGTSSLIERSMRTINQRINVGKWGRSGALAVAKIRAAFYYNGFDIR